MANPTDIRKGRVLLFNSAPHLVLDMQHRTQGRQAGFVQVNLRNLQSGSTTNHKFRSTETVEILMTETQKMEYSYVDGEGLHFLHPETFEDFVMSEEMVADQKMFLVEGTSYDILFIDGKAIRVELPASVVMKVVESAEGVKGDTASNVQKPATLETGLVVQVPLFIKEGEEIKVSTEDKSYQGRA